MKNTTTVAITIRSFDLSGPALKKLKENFTLSFINKTWARLSETDLINEMVKGIYILKNISERRIANNLLKEYRENSCVDQIDRMGN